MGLFVFPSLKETRDSSSCSPYLPMTEAVSAEFPAPVDGFSAGGDHWVIGVSRRGYQAEMKKASRVSSVARSRRGGGTPPSWGAATCAGSGEWRSCKEGLPLPHQDVCSKIPELGIPLQFCQFILPLRAEPQRATHDGLPSLFSSGPLLDSRVLEQYAAQA